MLHTCCSHLISTLSCILHAAVMLHAVHLYTGCILHDTYCTLHSTRRTLQAGYHYTHTLHDARCTLSPTTYSKLHSTCTLHPGCTLHTGYRLPLPLLAACCTTLMHALCCMLDATQFDVHTVSCTLQPAQWLLTASSLITLHVDQCMLHASSTMHPAHWTLHNARSTLAAPCTMHTSHCTLHNTFLHHFISASCHQSITSSLHQCNTTYFTEKKYLYVAHVVPALHTLHEGQAECTQVGLNTELQKLQWFQKRAQLGPTHETNAAEQRPRRTQSTSTTGGSTSRTKPPIFTGRSLSAITDKSPAILTHPDRNAGWTDSLQWPVSSGAKTERHTAANQIPQCSHDSASECGGNNAAFPGRFLASHQFVYGRQTAAH